MLPMKRPNTTPSAGVTDAHVAVGEQAGVGEVTTTRPASTHQSPTQAAHVCRSKQTPIQVPESVRRSAGQASSDVLADRKMLLWRLQVGSPKTVHRQSCAVVRKHGIEGSSPATRQTSCSHAHICMPAAMPTKCMLANPSMPRTHRLGHTPRRTHSAHRQQEAPTQN